jgi:transcriptional regulator with XRE-family HTH domain
MAIAAGVDVRTVQRGEAGQPLSLESLRAIAAAFDTTIDGLRLSTADLQKAIEEFKKNFVVIELSPLEQGRRLALLLDGVHAHLVHRAGDLSDTQADALAVFEQNLQDWLDLWHDLEPLQRRDAEKSLQEDIAALTSLDVHLSAACETLALNLGTGEAMRFPTLYVAATVGDRPLGALVRDRNTQFTFR